MPEGKFKGMMWWLQGVLWASLLTLHPQQIFAAGTESQRGIQQILTVLAPASMVDILPEIGKLWTEATGYKIEFSFAATPILVKQVMSGAPADVLITADKEWMDEALAKGGVLPSTLRRVASNQLVLIIKHQINKDVSNKTPSTASTPISPTISVTDPLASLTTSEGKLALAGEQVPAGRYAQAALQSLGFWQRLEAKVVRGDSVRTVLTWVSGSHVTSGIVYLTDAKSLPESVDILYTFPPTSHPPIVYMGGVVKNGLHPKIGSAFLDFCLSGVGRKHFEKMGFTFDLAS